MQRKSSSSRIFVLTVLALLFLSAVAEKVHKDELSTDAAAQQDVANFRFLLLRSNQDINKF